MFNKLFELDTSGIVDDSLSLIDTDFSKLSQDKLSNLANAKDAFVNKSINELKSKIKPTIADISIFPLVLAILSARKDSNGYKKITNPNQAAQIFIKHDYSMSFAEVDKYTNYRFDLDSGKSILTYALRKGSYKCIEYMIDKTEANIANITASANSDVDMLMQLIHDAEELANTDNVESKDTMLVGLERLKDELDTYMGSLMYFQTISESTHTSLNNEINLIINDMYETNDGTATLAHAEKYASGVNSILDALATIELQNRDMNNILMSIDQFIVTFIEVMSSTLTLLSIYTSNENAELITKYDAQRVALKELIVKVKSTISGLIDIYISMDIKYTTVVYDVLDSMVSAHPTISEFIDLRTVTHPKIDNIRTFETTLYDNTVGYVVLLNDFITAIDTIQTSLPISSDNLETTPLNTDILPEEVVNNMLTSLETLKAARDTYDESDSTYDEYNADYLIMKSKVNIISSNMEDINILVTDSETIYDDTSKDFSVKNTELTTQKENVDSKYAIIQTNKLIVDTISTKYGLDGTDAFDPIDALIDSTTTTQLNLVETEYGMIKFRRFVQDLFFKAIMYSRPSKGLSSLTKDTMDVVTKGNLYKLWKRCKPFIEVAAFGEDGSVLYGSKFSIRISTLNIIMPIVHDSTLNIDYVIPSDPFIPKILQEWLDYIPKFESGFNSELCVHTEIKRRLAMLTAPGSVIAAALNPILQSSLAALGLVDLVELMTHGDRWLHTFSKYLDQNDYIGDMI